MMIQVDNDGMKTVLSLIDVAIKAGAFQGRQQIAEVTNSIQVIKPEETPETNIVPFPVEGTQTC